MHGVWLMHDMLKTIILHKADKGKAIWGGLVNTAGGMYRRLCDAGNAVLSVVQPLSTFQFASINRDQSRRVDYWEMKFT